MNELAGYAKQVGKISKQDAEASDVGWGFPVGLSSVSSILRSYMGLSEYESRIYSSLLLNGPLTAGKIAVYSGVPRVKVYSSLKRLVDAGLVYEEPGRPARYGARDGAPTLGLIAERLESEARLLKKLSLIVRRIEKRRARGDVWVFEDPGSFASKIRELLFKARRRVNVIAGAEGLAFLYRKLGRTLDFIAGKGVSVEIYGWSNRVGAKALKELSYSYPVEIVETPRNLLVFVVDWEGCLLGFVRLKSGKFEVGPLIFLRGSEATRNFLKTVLGRLPEGATKGGSV